VIRLISAELLKLRKRSMTWILLYVLVGIMVILHLLLYAISKISLPGQTPPHLTDISDLLGLPVSLPFALSLLTSFGSVLAVILVASSMGNEYNWRTIRIALISSESRLRFLAAKLLSVMIMVLIGMVIGLAAGFAMSMLTTVIGGNSLDFSFATRTYLWDQFLQFWRAFFVIMTFTSLGFAFAVVGRSAMPGIAIGIGVLFLEPIITAFMRLAGGWVANIPNYLFSANVQAINALNNLPGNFGNGGFGSEAVKLPSLGQAYGVLAGYIIVFLILSFYLFRSRDVTG
jgi:ABC-2 type transport system permease protein